MRFCTLFALLNAFMCTFYPRICIFVHITWLKDCTAKFRRVKFEMILFQFTCSRMWELGRTTFKCEPNWISSSSLSTLCAVVQFFDSGHYFYLDFFYIKRWVYPTFQPKKVCTGISLQWWIIRQSLLSDLQSKSQTYTGVGSSLHSSYYCSFW